MANIEHVFLKAIVMFVWVIGPTGMCLSGNINVTMNSYHFHVCNNSIYEILVSDLNLIFLVDFSSSYGSPCLPNPCLNGGNCVVDNDDTWQCNCAPGFSGDTCEHSKYLNSHF